LGGKTLIKYLAKQQLRGNAKCRRSPQTGAEMFSLQDAWFALFPPWNMPDVNRATDSH